MKINEFKTLAGGILSSAIKIAIFWITILLTITIFQRGNTATSINEIIKDITIDQTKHYFAYIIE